MNIKMGEKIKELRRRDGRTQELLADALGVTNQAISRWEANGGYPDMESIPAIANYFHITIDELFGYHMERDEKIQKILDEADSMIQAQSDMAKCIEFLREAVSEFPAEAQIMIRLGYSLSYYGFLSPGARRVIKKGSDHAENDVEYNSGNGYFSEALAIFSRALSMGINPDDRKLVIPLMVRLYGLMGAYDKAEELAQKQDPVAICRECLLPNTADGEKRDIYLGEALLALIKGLKDVMELSVWTQHIYVSETKIQKFLGIANLYELIFDDGNCGEYHVDLKDIYKFCAVNTARLGDIVAAMEYFNTCFYHAKKYEEIRNNQSHQYTAPLVAKVTTVNSKWPKAPVSVIKGLLNHAPDELIKAVKEDERYAECFAD